MAKYRTTRKLGYLPEGMLVQVISLAYTTGGHPSQRDHYLGDLRDGQNILVTYPGGTWHATAHSMEELAALGITAEDLEEVKE